MKKPFSWSVLGGVGISALLVVSIARQVAAGPQTVPNADDARRATRIVSPVGGPDERAIAGRSGSVAGNGVIEPIDRETKVASQVAGRIKTIYVHEGDTLEAGTPIAELENATEKAQLAASEGDLAAARADLLRTRRGLRKEDVDAIVADTEAMRSKATLSGETLARTETLAKGGAATPDELDRARRQHETDERSLEAQEARRRAAVAGSRVEDVLVAETKVQAALARRDQSKAQLERLTITAPIHGTILQLKYRAGEYISPGAVDPLAIMGDIDRLRVRMDVDERDIAKIKVGAGAFVTLNAAPDRRVGGHVVEIGKRMGRKNIRTDDPVERIDTKILEVVIELDDKRDLLPGLRVVSYVDTAENTGNR